MNVFEEHKCGEDNDRVDDQEFSIPELKNFFEEDIRHQKSHNNVDVDSNRLKDALPAVLNWTRYLFFKCPMNQPDVNEPNDRSQGKEDFFQFKWILHALMGWVLDLCLKGFDVNNYMVMV